MRIIYFINFCSKNRFFLWKKLIPADDFLEVRKDEYELLIKSSLKNHEFTIDNQEHIIDNLLFQNILWNGRSGTHQIHEYSNICFILQCYADGMDEDCYMDMKDKKWYDNSIGNLCGGFHHIKNYTKCKSIKSCKGKNINIINSFLVLELDDGKLRISKIETVEQLLTNMVINPI